MRDFQRPGGATHLGDSIKTARDSARRPVHECGEISQSRAWLATRPPCPKGRKRDGRIAPGAPAFSLSSLFPHEIEGAPSFAESAPSILRSEQRVGCADVSSLR